MKRKDFIQKIGFVGVGLGLTPWKLLSATSSTQRFVLPQPTVHIPHGNFAAAEVAKLKISEFDLECSVHQFMRNGIKPSNDDLKIHSFQRSNEFLFLSITRDGKVTTEGGIEGLRINIDSFVSSSFTVSKS